MLPKPKSNPLRESGLHFRHDAPANPFGAAGTPAAQSIREAGCAFVRGTASGWSRRDLAAWLLCHYAPATARANGAAPSNARAFASEAVDDALLEEIILDARVKTLRLLADLAFPSLAAARARELLAHGAVARVSFYGGALHAPVALARLRLSERVESLFVADWLNAPFDYRSIDLCRACGALAVGHVPPEHETWCPRATDESDATVSRASA